MPPERSQNQTEDFKPLDLAARLVRKIRIGTLATLEKNGAPLATLTTIGLDEDGVPLIFISSLSAHTQNLSEDPRFSLLLAELGKGDPLAHPRVSLSGIATQTMSEAAKIRFIEQNPKSKLYAEFADFSLWRLVPQKIHLNGGFARAYSGDAQEMLDLLRN